MVMNEVKDSLLPEVHDILKKSVEISQKTDPSQVCM